MRRGLILAGALILITASGAHAEDWCGYAAQAKSIIECGYSTAAECETATGKGGMCFVDPDYALNEERAAPAPATPMIGVKLGAARS